MQDYSQSINIVSPDDDKFLQRASVIAKPPKRLWYIGNLPAPAPTVAIVGSRKPTNYGREITLGLASDLAARGVIIVSGLALGHDALAHRGALDSGGITVAVLANGLPRIYPNTNRSLAQEILAKNGAILSEYEPETPVSKWQFLERNRLVAALADVVVVVEAGERSGTLNTAMHALEQGKELMAVPGNITSPLSVGCNRLIAQGATPVLSVDDIFAKLNLSPTNTKSPELANLTVNEALIFQLIAGGATNGDELIAKSKLSPAEVSGTLTMLEIYGLIRPLGANNWVAK